jgi:hypothetical protein
VRYLNIERRIGKRLLIHGGLWTNMNLPQLHFTAEGPDYVSIGATYGNDGCDPVLGFDLDLSGTRLGRWLDCLSEKSWRKQANDRPEDGCGDCTPEGNHPCRAGCRDRQAGGSSAAGEPPESEYEEGIRLAVWRDRR